MTWTLVLDPAAVARSRYRSGMRLDGYMVKVTWDGEWLIAEPTNKAARFGLLGPGGKERLELHRNLLAGVKHTSATLLTNGRVVVSTHEGSSYQLHYRRKAEEGFTALAAELAPLVRSQPVPVAEPSPAVEPRADPPAPAQPSPLQVSGSSARLVVGAGYYPGAYRKVKVGQQYNVTLAPEPQNPHDRNAVAAYLNGQLCGYLGSNTAEWFQPLALTAQRQGHYVWTQGVGEMVTGERSVRLNAFPTEIEFKVLLGLPVPARGKLKRLGKSELVIDQVLGGREKAVVQVVLTSEETPSGKYAGQSMIRATFDGQTLGLIPAQYRDECPDLFGLIEQAPRSAEADVRRFEYGPWIRVTVTPSL